MFKCERAVDCILGGGLHLRPGIAAIRAWRYEIAFAYDRKLSDRQQLDLEREDYFRKRMLMCLSQVCISNVLQVAGASNNFTVAPNICGSSQCNLLRV